MARPGRPSPTSTGQLTSDAFTADSKYATYLTFFSAIGTAGYVGNLLASPVAGGPAIPVSMNEVAESQFLTGSKIIYNDNFMLSADGTLGYADISTLDLSAATLTPKLIMQQADQYFLLTTDRATLVFGLSVGNATTNGIYAYKL